MCKFYTKRRIMNKVKAFVYFFAIMIAFCSIADAAGTMTGGAANTWVDIGNGNYAITVSWVDDTAGTTGTIYVPASMYGMWAGVAITDPGTTAPTALYDIVLSSTVSSRWASLDIFDGNLMNRSATVTEKATWSMAPFPLYGPITFTLSGNAVNNATGTLTLILTGYDGPGIYGIN
jgi:hypothetical protein